MNFLTLGTFTFFKTFVFLFDEVTLVLLIPQLFDLIKLCDCNGIGTVNHLNQK